MNNRRRFLAGASVLMGHAAFPSVMGAFLAGACAQRERSFFAQKEMRALTALVDVILPETDSPAASAANTHVFVDAAMEACATEAQQDVVREGLANLDARAQEAHGADFAALTPAQQAEILTPIAQADAEKPYDESFFLIVKDYTLTGYFLSETGATQALAYEQIPGTYQGDLPLAPGQKAWAI